METDLRKRLHPYLKSYIPGEITHPNEKALFDAQSLYGLTKKESDAYKLKAIKYVFNHHYQNNKFYHGLCDQHNVSPESIKKITDFSKIPLIPHRFFKDYPQGRDFAIWLANLMSVNVPQITIKQKNPSFDEIIDAFGMAGVTVCYSSGTTGKFTFIPRDQTTYHMGQYAIARCSIEMLSHWWEHDSHAFLLFPNPDKTNLYVGKVTNVLKDLVKSVDFAMDRKINTELLRIAMGVTFTFKEKMMSKIARSTSKKRNVTMVDRILKWLEERNKNNDKILFAGAPFILNMVMDKLNEEGKTYDFGVQGAVLTGGGWKIYEDKRLPVADFRKKVEESLGIPRDHCLDLYAMVESNGFLVHCSKGHYLHIPTTYFHTMVLDEDDNEVSYGEEGRFAFLDSLAMSYPGFISTGDKVRIHEHCPDCDREGPVLEPEVERIKGEEIRGCAEEMRRILMEE